MRRAIILLLACCAVCLCLVTSAFAADLKIAGITTISRSEEDRLRTAKNLKLELLDNDNYKAGISSFDVSKEGKIALAISNGRIYVYDADGNFLYGYRFQTQGAYGVVFAGENVAIYLVRGDALAVYDPEGNCIDLQDVIYPGNPDSTWLYQRVSKQQNGKTYMLQRDVELTNTYGRLVIADADGNRSAFYDVSLQHTIGVLLRNMAIVGFFVFVIIGIYKQYKKAASMEGIWYCQELKLQVSLDDYQNAFFMDNGEKILCKCYLSGNGRNLDVYCREFEHPKYRNGKTILGAEVRHYEDMSMRVYDRKTWQEYTFVRTDKVG